VVFEPDPSGLNPAGRAKQALLTAPHGATATWELVYEANNAVTMLPRCHDTWPHNKPTVPVSMLQAVKVPTSPKTAFAMTYELGSVPASSCRQGLLTRLALPTAGNENTVCNGGQHCAGIEWSYADYQMPLAACDGRVHFSLTPGVVEKRVYATTGLSQPTGKWTYLPTLTTTSDPARTVQCSDGFPPQYSVEHFYTFTNTVTNLLNDQTVHHFSVLPRPNHEVPQPPSVVSRWQEFSLPLTRAASITGSDGKTLYLSEEIKDCTSPTNCTTAAKKYVRYDRDASLFYLSSPITDRYDLQRRPVSERTVYLPGLPKEHFVENTRTDFDGVGHYRNMVELGGGWALAGGARTVTTYFNPESRTYMLDDNDQPTTQHNYVSLAGRSPWKLDTYVSIARTQGGSAAAERTCFDSGTGFLERRRLYANGAGPGTHDVIVVYGGKTAQGNVTGQTFYGGDKATLNTGTDVCAANFPFPAADYATVRGFGGGGGLPTSMEWKEGAATVLRQYLASVDVNGARVLSTTEPDEIRTDYHYDVLGRLEWIKPGGANPPANEKFTAWTRFTYGTAAAGGCVAGNPDSCASLLVERFTAGSFGGAPLERRRYRFDGLGRLIRDGIGVPGIAATEWSEVVTKYDSEGQVFFRSERHTTNPDNIGTSFSGFDVFGRPTQVVSADGTSVDLSYVGVQAETRTTKIARFNGTFVNGQALPPIVDKPTDKTTTFDALHRVAEVLGNANGPTSGQLKTGYLYDVGDRVTGVRMTELGTNLPQNRDFAYDGLGRLRSEDHPELLHTGSAVFCGSGAHTQSHDVVYDGYDSLGNLLRKCDDEVDLVFKYDRAQRLTEVRRVGEHPNDPCNSEVGTCLEKRIYGVGTTAGNRSAGKLAQASSFNYRSDTAPPPANTALFGAVELIYNYSYDGTVAVDGGLSSRTLKWSVSTNPTLAPVPFAETFKQDFSYTSLGLPAKVDYPTCEFAGCTRSPRLVSLGYTEGMLTNVSGYATLTYWPHPMLRRVTFADSRIWQQDPDVSHLPRPKFICIPVAGTPASVDCTTGLGPYTYDGDGNLKTVGGEKWVYDEYGQVVYGQMSSGEYERFGYDLFDNMQTKWYGRITNGVAADSSVRNLPTSLTTNRLVGANYGYDQRGNLIAWDGNTYKYDERGRLGVAHQAGKVRWYFYDVDGERTLTFEPPEFTPDVRPNYDWTLRGLDGKALRWLQFTRVNGVFTWTWKKDYVYRNGAPLAYETPAGRGTYFVDHLATPRLVYAENGSVSGHHYYPFGEEAFFQSGDAEAIKFTGHERDLFDTTSAQDDIDYMHARSYEPLLGRFMSPDRFDMLGLQRTSPDRFGELLRQPASWNLYGYAINNPVKYQDPDGRAWQLVFAGAGGGTATAGTGAAGGTAAFTAGALPVVAAGLAGVALGYGIDQIPGVSDFVTIDKLSDAIANVMLASAAKEAKNNIDGTLTRTYEHIGTGGYPPPNEPNDPRWRNVYNRLKHQLESARERVKELWRSDQSEYLRKVEQALADLEKWFRPGG
jgi:RHS repeat-associated protein